MSGIGTRNLSLPLSLVDALKQETWFVLFHTTARYLISEFLPGKQLSQKSVEAVQAHFTPLLALANRMESNTQLDTQDVVFNISDKVIDLG